MSSTQNMYTKYYDLLLFSIFRTLYPLQRNRILEHNFSKDGEQEWDANR